MCTFGHIFSALLPLIKRSPGDVLQHSTARRKDENVNSPFSEYAFKMKKKNLMKQKSVFTWIFKNYFILLPKKETSK